MKSWLAGGFNTKVINRIMELVNSQRPGSEKLKILITGAVLQLDSILGWAACMLTS